ncbi:MAG: hypothetical protein N0E48_15955 [Candidatus Thiodiazotropha endolucinida]|nr:hypothetical protein [Candidatus Thiodiazotropha endolucinida]
MDSGFFALRGHYTIFYNRDTRKYSSEPGTFQQFEKGIYSFYDYGIAGDEGKVELPIVFLDFDQPAFLPPEGDETEIVALPFEAVTASDITLDYGLYYNDEWIEGPINYWRVTKAVIYDRDQNRLLELPVRPFWDEDNTSETGELRLREGWIKKNSFFSIYRFSINMS